MIPEVGGIANVSGSRIATPLAPPRPGSTPMMVPSVMPTTAMKMLYGVSAMANPPRMFSTPTRSVPEPRLEGSLRHRHEEPLLEDEERHDGDADREARHEEPRGAPAPAHLDAHVERRGDVETDELHEDHPRRRRRQDLQHGPELLALDEALRRATEQRLDEDEARGHEQEHREPEREKAAPGPFLAPADAEPDGVVHDDAAQQHQHRGRDQIGAAHLLLDEAALFHQLLVQLLGALHPRHVLGARRERGPEGALVEVVLEVLGVVDLLQEADVPVDGLLRHVGGAEDAAEHVVLDVEAG